MWAEITGTTLKRDRFFALAGLIAITVLAWIYTIHLAISMGNTAQTGMPVMNAWESGDMVLTFLMWVVMMTAMMTPSAAPMILTFAGIKRRQQPEQTSVPAALTFLLGYLIAWSLFSAAATLTQRGLSSAALLSPGMMSVSPILNGTVWIVAGIYQLTPLKNICLSHCRTPVGFMMKEWREGTRGALTMGVRHGFYCIGCCWLLMALLFVTGVMNLIWSALIAGIVLVEKVIPGGQWVSRIIGLLMAGWGVWLLASAVGM